MTRKKSGEGVPALQNEDVMGMTEEKQDAVIRESGRASRRRQTAASTGRSAPGWTRTTDPQLRRLLLYPTELRARNDLRDSSCPWLQEWSQKAAPLLPVHLRAYPAPVCRALVAIEGQP
jgi:hypothetical protein